MAMLYMTSPVMIPFVGWFESVQYNAALAITCPIKGTSREQLYQELDLERLSDRRRYRRLVYLFNIVSCHSPANLCSLLPDKQRSYDPVRSNLFRNFNSQTNFFKTYFFPYCISECNNLGPNLRNSTSVTIFKKMLLAFIRPKQCDIYNIIDPSGLKLLTRLRDNLSHLRGNKFRHNFLNTLNPLCSCSLEIESTSHHLLRCPFYTPWQYNWYYWRYIKFLWWWIN